MPTQADNTIIRVQTEKVHDDQPQQMIEALGRAHERFGGTKGVPRIQEYGYTSHPPKGSQGVTTVLGGNPDNTMLVGLEHPEYRPKNLEEGEFKKYDMWGHFLYAPGESVVLQGRRVGDVAEDRRHHPPEGKEDHS